MKGVSLLLIFLFAAYSFLECTAHSQHHDTKNMTRFEDFVMKYNKAYPSASDFKFRRFLFKWNQRLIMKHNEKYEKGLVTYFLKENEFMDHTLDEFHKKMKLKTYSFVDPNRSNVTMSVYEKENIHGILPDRIDWREKNAVSPVKNQGQCGSCWSFSTTGAVEGAVAVYKGVLHSLSEQELIDCSTSYGNNGCNGGYMPYGFKYVAEHGLVAESMYPYMATQQQCNQQIITNVTVPSGGSSVELPSGDVEALQIAVTKQPVSVAIEADQHVFQFYGGGVIGVNDGCGTNLDHGVLLVGYDMDPVSKKKYWIVKNSWGSSWGLDGYVHLELANTCGIALSASYYVPTF